MKGNAMTISGCVLNFTSSGSKLELDPAFNGFERLPDCGRIPKDGVLTLYILGHAVPNQLLDRQGNILPEKDLAADIRKYRGSSPTLIVWDVCYARSFELIAQAPIESWGDNFVHIFSSQAYERTWRLPPDDKGKGISFFSTQLRRAIAAAAKADSWAALQKQLREQYGDLQSPEIVANEKSTPSQFDLPSAPPS
jgi:hypothetical protein